MDNRWQVEVDGVSQAEWSQLLDLFSDANIYQTWSYGAVRWGSKNLSHIVIKRDGEPVAIAQIRIIRPTKFKFGMAYLRWGPICERRGKPLEAEVVQRISHALEEEYVERRRLLLHVLPNAFIGSQRAELFQEAFGRFRPKQLSVNDDYRTFVVDLAPPVELLRKQLDAKWRNKLAQAEKKTLRILSGNGAQEYRRFCDMYYEMRKRKSFDTSVDVEEFGQIQQNLPENHRMQVLICEVEGAAAAGIVCSSMGDSAIYLLGATTDAGLDSRGAYLLQWAMMQRLKEAGIRWYDLGGIDSEKNPGVYSFKKGLSGTDLNQMKPVMACKSMVSAAMVEGGLAVHQSLRSGFGIFRLTQRLRMARS